MFLKINGILINFAQVMEVTFSKIHADRTAEKGVIITYINGKTTFLRFDSNEDAEKMKLKIIQTIGAVEL